MPDRLVDHQPQIGRVNDQVVVARLDRGCGQLLGQQIRQPGQLGIEVPAGAGQVLETPAGRRGQRAHGLEPAAGFHRDRGEHRVQPDPLLGGRGRAVGEELAFPDLEQRGVDVVDHRAGQQPRAPVGQQGQLVRDVDAERILLVGGDPADIPVTRLGCQVDALGVHRGGDLGHVDRFLGRPHRRLRGQVHRGGKAPGPVQHHADREAQLVRIQQRLQMAVGQPDLLAPDALGAEIGVLRAQLPGPLQGGRGELAQRQPGELGIDPVPVPGAPAGFCRAWCGTAGLVLMSTVLHEWQPIPRPPAPAGYARQAGQYRPADSIC